MGPQVTSDTVKGLDAPLTADIVQARAGRRALGDV